MVETEKKNTEMKQFSRIRSALAKRVEWNLVER